MDLKVCLASRACIATSLSDVDGAVLRVCMTWPAWGSKKVLPILLRRVPNGDWHARGAMVAPKAGDVKNQFHGAFHRCGLPRTTSSDNGPPFASAVIGFLLRLSVWMLRFGVNPIRIHGVKQDGKHERFHEALKAEAV